MLSICEVVKNPAQKLFLEVFFLNKKRGRRVGRGWGSLGEFCVKILHRECHEVAKKLWFW